MNSPLPKRARNFQENIPPTQKEKFNFKKPSGQIVRFCVTKLNFEKHPVHNYDQATTPYAKNESKKASNRPSVICPYPEPKKMPSNVEQMDTAMDQSEDEDGDFELTNEMLLDLKAKFKTIKESFNNDTDDVIRKQTVQSNNVSMDETTVVNSIVTNDVNKNADTDEKSQKHDVIKEDIIKDDAIKNPTQNAQNETKRTKTSQKRPSKSNIQFQVPKKLQVKRKKK